MQPANDPAARETRRYTSRILLGVLLVSLLVAAALLRFTDINWDRFQHVHPDERFIIWVADTMKWPSDAAGGFASQLGVALDPSRSPLNPLRWPPGAGETAGKPRNFAYGHFPLYLLVGSAHLAAAVGEWFGATSLAFPAWMQPINTIGRHLAEYNYLALVGRTISALADLGTLLIVWAMGLRVGRGMFGLATEVTESSEGAARERGPSPKVSVTSVARTVAFLAAGFYAFAVLPIQLSHFAAVDALLTFFVVATVALAARYAEQGGRWTWALAGVAAGLAVGSKFSAVMLALPLLAAALFRVSDGPLSRKAFVVGRRIALVGLIALLTFILTNPFAVLEWRQYIWQILAQNQMVSGAMDAPYTRQYIGTLPYVYFVQQLSQWGVGWPAAIVAWAGMVWALVRFGLGKASPALTVLLAWAFPYFVVTGAFHTKFLRYMAPLLPFLMVFGAAAAVAAYGAVTARWGRRGRVAWMALAGIAGAFTLLWSVAFTNVYRAEHPWIQASDWIYRNVPEGATILSEEWDDALPLAMDELADRPPIRQYKRLELPVWDPDTLEKVEKLSAHLAEADYVTVASNRIYAPVARLTGRYPMTSQYYRQLFAGELGYELVADFSAYPQLGRQVIRTDHADESLSVYDHPHAYVFRNVGQLSQDELSERLARYLPSASRSAKSPGHASIRLQSPDPAQSLLLDRPVDTLPDVTDYRWNPIASASPVLAAFLWWLVITLFGWFAWPLLFPLARGLADRGHGLVRTLGWLLLGWIHWMGVSLGLWQNALGPLLVVLLVLLLVGLIGWTTQRHAMAAFWVERRRLILGQEILFAGAFLFFVLIRLLNPDLWQPWNGGEKFMDFAFLNATLRSPVFPPYDPYFAGGMMNYYYFGLYLVGLPIRLTGIFAEVAFNLAVPSLFALSAVGIFSAGYSIAGRSDDRVTALPAVTEPPQRGRRVRPVRPVLAGLLAVVLTLLLGNLTGLEWAFKALAGLMQGKAAPAFDYWAASRVIPYTINEFPLWTFTFADLHPHLISIPFGILVVGLGLNWLRGRPVEPRQWAVQFLALSLALGALGAINTWDLPTYALLLTGVMLIAAWRTPVPGVARARALAGAALTAFALLALSIALYWPFYRHYQAQVGGGSGFVVGRFLGLVNEASPIRPWLMIWGFFLFLAVSYTLVELFGRRVAAEVARSSESGDGSPASDAATGKSDSVEQRRPPRAWLFGGLVIMAMLAVLAAAGRPTVALAGLPLILVLPLIVDRRAEVGPVYAGLLLAVGLSVIAGIELVYLRDFLEGGDWYRMNTLFKFSVPAWLFLGLAGGYILARLWSLTESAPVWVGAPWQVAAALLLAGSLVYLFVGVRERVLDRFPDARPAIGTLDGMAYMAVGEYNWPDGEERIRLASDYDALKWMLANVKGTPVVAEAPAGSYTVRSLQVTYDYYRAGGLRVASATGLPTFVGQHQNEQRSSEQVALQTAKGMKFFRTTDLAEARRLIEELHVGYIYVGHLERLLFPAVALRKFDVLAEAGELRVAYQNSEITIYEVT